MSMPINLGEMLIKEGHISPQQLEEALAHQKKEHRALGQILLKLGFLSQEQLTEVLARRMESRVWILRSQTFHRASSVSFLEKRRSVIT